MSSNSDFVIENGVLVKYNGPGGEVVIPDGVKKIGFTVHQTEDSQQRYVGAFENCTTLTGVTLPDSGEELSFFAFKGCTSLEYVRLPDHGVKMDSPRIFEDCVSLTKIEPLESINFVFGVGYRAFHNCVKLTRMYMTGINVHNSAFAGCCSLEEFIVSPRNTFLQAAGNVLYNSDKTELICAPAASGTFSIPEGVKKLGDEAFSGCKDLTSVVIPKSLTKIGYGAFSGCTALERFDVPEDHPKFRGEGPALMGKDGSTLVLAPTASDTFPVPDGITAIGDGAFYGNQLLEHVILPQGLTIVGDGAFQDCTNLKYVEVPETLNKIETQAFASCSSLQEIYFPENLVSIEEEAFESCSSLKELHFPESLKKIGRSAFANCSSLTHINYTNNLRVFRKEFPLISNYNRWDYDTAYFSGCPITEIDVDAGHPKFKMEDGVMFSKDRKKLLWCSPKLSGEYVVPDGVRTIESGSFFGCQQLTNVRVPEKTLVIQADAMDGCPAALCVKQFAISDLDKSLQNSAIRGFAFMERAGEEQDEEVRAANLKYIKRMKKKLYETAFQSEDLLALMLGEKMIPIEDAELLIQQAESAGREDLAAQLKTYLETAFTPAQRKRAQEKKQKEIKQE